MSDRAGAPLTNPRAPRVRAVAALARRAVRDREGRFLAEGPQAVREAVRFRPDAVVEVFVEAGEHRYDDDILEPARARGVRVVPASAQVLAAMADTPHPQGVLAVCRPVDVPLATVLGDGGRAPRVVAVLAHVRDPGNAGTVIRGADAAGADAVIVSDASVDVYNPKVVRSTVGSLFHVPICVGVPMPAILAELARAGVTRLAADGAGTVTLGEADLSVAHAWVLGNEAWGLPDEIRQACDAVVRVPIHGHAESLNLAMAATLCLYASADAARR